VARGGTVGCGTAVQAGRSRVRLLVLSLKPFIDINFPAAIWVCDRIRPTQKLVPGIFPGDEVSRCLGLTYLPLSCADCLEICESRHHVLIRSCQDCNGTALPLPLYRTIEIILIFIPVRQSLWSDSGCCGVTGSVTRCAVVGWSWRGPKY